jgi:hypothetical protein
LLFGQLAFAAFFTSICGHFSEPCALRPGDGRET